MKAYIKKTFYFCLLIGIGLGINFIPNAVIASGDCENDDCVIEEVMGEKTAACKDASTEPGLQEGFNCDAQVKKCELTICE